MNIAVLLMLISCSPLYISLFPKAEFKKIDFEYHFLIMFISSVFSFDKVVVSSRLEAAGEKKSLKNLGKRSIIIAPQEEPLIIIPGGRSMCLIKILCSDYFTGILDFFDFDTE